MMTKSLNSPHSLSRNLNENPIFGSPPASPIKSPSKPLETIQEPGLGSPPMFHRIPEPVSTIPVAAAAAATDPNPTSPSRTRRISSHTSDKSPEYFDPLASPPHPADLRIPSRQRRLTETRVDLPKEIIAHPASVFDRRKVNEYIKFKTIPGTKKTYVPSFASICYCNLR